MTRETIYDNLFDLIDGLRTKQNPLVKTVSRKLRHWADVSSAEQPAIFQIQKGESSKQVLKVPAIWTLNVDLYVYVNTSSDPSVAPTTLLNPIIDALDALFPPNEPSGPQTLSGTVSHCWITGNIETAEGVLGDQEVAIVPIEILGAE